jgi:hypothetical protein
MLALTFRRPQDLFSIAFAGLARVARRSLRSRRSRVSVHIAVSTALASHTSTVAAAGQRELATWTSRDLDIG